MAIPATLDWQVYDPTGRRKYLNQNETDRFLAVADGYDLARHALCYLLAYTGCRISEALAFMKHQIDEEQMAVQFRTLKRRKTVFRNVPVPPFVIELLLALPAGEDGRLWTMHRTTAWRIIKAAMRRAQIVGPMACPKGLRHAYGIRAAEGGSTPTVIQEVLGHATLRTTMVYMNAVGVEKRALAARAWENLRVSARVAVPVPKRPRSTRPARAPALRIPPPHQLPPPATVFPWWGYG
ncbi:phage integrase family protein [Nitrospirillum amazonense]|uniref:Phage integrase family protein n=1 Tax=Nitrospirillum amazonense TaxID=28077 RepID=A0A560F1R1_9PROT|nr:tyrosine-type recombinase/integrase [Nitrospirillum amazonense]TWB15527.1 phage integrase family protein [Nitrospirillum amazonense]